MKPRHSKPIAYTKNKGSKRQSVLVERQQNSTSPEHSLEDRFV